MEGAENVEDVKVEVAGEDDTSSALRTLMNETIQPLKGELDTLSQEQDAAMKAISVVRAMLVDTYASSEEGPRDFRNTFDRIPEYLRKIEVIRTRMDRLQLRAVEAQNKSVTLVRDAEAYLLDMDRKRLYDLELDRRLKVEATRNPTKAEDGVDSVQIQVQGNVSKPIGKKKSRRAVKVAELD